MNKPFLSVVTRTKNREIMLSRLMKHLLKQHFVDFEWVIVNDAGVVGGVKKIVNDATLGGMHVTLIDNPISNGRSAAANIGVKAAKGKYVIILDDDDFPRDEYFAMVHRFLSDNHRYLGVACWAEITLEQLKDDKIINCGVEGTYSPVPNDLSILSLHTLNIPPCSVVLHRETFLEVGGYPEDIDCTEDWAFICDFIMKGNIGVIPDVLVNYSKRINPEGFYKNTTSDKVGMFQHLSDEVVWRNKKIRECLSNNSVAGLIPILGSMNMKAQDIRVTLQKFEVMQDQIDYLKNKYSLISGELANVLGSNSWKITKPLRKFIALFRKSI